MFFCKINKQLFPFPDTLNKMKNNLDSSTWMTENPEHNSPRMTKNYCLLFFLHNFYKALKISAFGSSQNLILLHDREAPRIFNFHELTT